jgi:hypothetical protein
MTTPSVRFERKLPTYPLPGGGRCTVPVAWPERVESPNGFTYRYAGEGRRAGDQEPAARYESRAGFVLWFCEGRLHVESSGRDVGEPLSIG